MIHSDLQDADCDGECGGLRREAAEERLNFEIYIDLINFY